MRSERWLKAEEIYHICNKSIANFGILKDPNNANRLIQTLGYYNTINRQQRFSEALKRKKYTPSNLIVPRKDAMIKFLCYCVMPDHYHILIKVLYDDVFSKFINDVENSFTRYFNIKFKRKGPLWQSRFRAVRIKTNEQLLHVTRYIHLNPTTSELVENPEDWKFSSYRDYIDNNSILDYLDEISIRSPLRYKRFVEDRKNYQQQLRRIKNLLLE